MGIKLRKDGALLTIKDMDENFEFLLNEINLLKAKMENIIPKKD